MRTGSAGCPLLSFSHFTLLSMVVYVSEYYYGIAEQRKVELASRRVDKLITMTETNDKMKAEYNESAQKVSPSESFFLPTSHSTLFFSTARRPHEESYDHTGRPLDRQHDGRRKGSSSCLCAHNT